MQILKMKESLCELSFISLFQTHLRVPQMPSGEQIKISHAHVRVSDTLTACRQLELFIFFEIKKRGLLNLIKHALIQEYQVLNDEIQFHN